LSRGAGPGEAAGEGDVAEEHAEVDGHLVVLGAPTGLTTPPLHADRRRDGGLESDALQDGVGAVAAGELRGFLDGLVATLGDDVGGAELPARVGPVLAPSHEHDLPGAGRRAVSGTRTASPGRRQFRWRLSRRRAGRRSAALAAEIEHVVRLHVRRQHQVPRA
jgi:hypothetical protein